MKAKDMMSSPACTVSPDASVAEAAALMLERHRIKRMPVVEHGGLVGILSRADLIGAVAKRGGAARSVPDAGRHRGLLASQAKQPWAGNVFVNFEPRGGVVHLRDRVYSEAGRPALRVPVDALPDTRGCRDETDLIVAPEPA